MQIYCHFTKYSCCFLFCQLRHKLPDFSIADHLLHLIQFSPSYVFLNNFFKFIPVSAHSSQSQSHFLFLPPRNNLFQRNVFLWSLYLNKYNDLRKQSCFIFSHLSADWANSTEIFCCGGWGAGWLKPLKVFLGSEIVWQSVWSIMWVLQ